MPPQSAVNLQRQMGANFNAKVLIWKKSIEQTVAALNMLDAVVEQVPARGHDDMEITIEIHFDETPHTKCEIFLILSEKGEMMGSCTKKYSRRLSSNFVARNT